MVQIASVTDLFKTNRHLRILACWNVKRHMTSTVFQLQNKKVPCICYTYISKPVC